MRWLNNPGPLLALALLCAACSGGEPLPLEEMRGHVTSPKPLRYLTQTLGAGHAGEAAPGGGPTLWYPLAPAEAGRRLVLRFDAGERLARAEVVAAGPQGRYDVTEEVLFDRANWPRPPAP